ncbi:MAG: hypothetical protein RL687_75, partial [Candidatus Parcubacteria bacterium]
DKDAILGADKKLTIIKISPSMNRLNPKKFKRSPAKLNACITKCEPTRDKPTILKITE